MSSRLLLASIGAVLATTIAAALLGVLAALPFRLAWAVAGLAFGVGLFRLPSLLRALLARVDARVPDAVLALAAGGSAAVGALLGLGGHAFVASAVSERWLEEVGRLWFPVAPLAGILAGLGWFAYGELLRWAAGERAEDEQP